MQQQYRLSRTNVYVLLGWTIFWISLILSILDRYFGNKGDTLRGTDRETQDKEQRDNLGQTLANVAWAVTARIILAGFNMMFYSIMWVFPNVVANRFPTIDMRERNIQIHRWVGKYMLVLPILIHVGAIFIAPMFSGQTFTIRFMGFTGWKRWWDPVINPFGGVWVTDKEVNLSYDDIFRFCASVLVLCLILPLSLSNGLFAKLSTSLRPSFNVRAVLHLVMAMWIAFDLVRKTQHKLSHVINLPMLILWVLDRVASIAWYRRRGPEVTRLTMLDESHAVVFLKVDHLPDQRFAETYYLLHDHVFSKRALAAPGIQRSHAFTGVRNYRTNPDQSWDVCIVMRLSEGRKGAWTQWVAKNVSETAENKLTMWGPYHSPTSCLLASFSGPMVLFASGTGCGYLIEWLTHAYESGMWGQSADEESEGCAPSVQLHFACRSAALVDFFVESLKNVKLPSHITCTVYQTCTPTAPPKLASSMMSQDAEVPSYTSIPLQVVVPSMQGTLCYAIMDTSRAGRSVTLDNASELSQTAGMGSVGSVTSNLPKLKKVVREQQKPLQPLNQNISESTPVGLPGESRTRSAVGDSITRSIVMVSSVASKMSDEIPQMASRMASWLSNDEGQPRDFQEEMDDPEHVIPGQLGQTGWGLGVTKTDNNDQKLSKVGGVRVVMGRPDVKKLLVECEEGSVVHCIGGASLQNQLANVCKEKDVQARGVRFVRGEAF